MPLLGHLLSLSLGCFGPLHHQHGVPVKEETFLHARTSIGNAHRAINQVLPFRGSTEV